MTKYCCFFGHRHLLDEDFIRKKIIEAVITLITYEDVTHFFVGEHGTFDKIAWSAVQEVKEDFPGIQIILVTSYPTQPYPTAGYYDDIIRPVPGNQSSRFAILCRNDWVVQHCTHLIGYVNRSPGGAYRAMKQAANQGKIIVNLAYQNR